MLRAGHPGWEQGQCWGQTLKNLAVSYMLALKASLAETMVSPLWSPPPQSQEHSTPSKAPTVASCSRSREPTRLGTPQAKAWALDPFPSGAASHALVQGWSAAWVMAGSCPRLAPNQHPLPLVSGSPAGHLLWDPPSAAVQERVLGSVGRDTPTPSTDCHLVLLPIPSAWGALSTAQGSTGVFSVTPEGASGLLWGP